ncbi:MAG: hypothetical protein IKN27_09705 [Selenomonadaceae bacterium]|nr:hypothetical protein [Selenomonadaceae bacterium]
MPEKDTVQLENELRDADDVEKFCNANADNFRKFTLAEYLCRLLDEKKLSRAQVIKNSQLGDYAYHFFAGRKKTSRKNILSLAVALNLSPKDANRLLYYAGHENLYVRNRWDSVIFFGLENHYGIEEINELLTTLNMSPLLGNMN